MNDHELAAALADEAGRLLLQLRREYSDAEPNARKAAGDRGSHELLARRLLEERPRDAVLSEEGIDDSTRLVEERLWIIDPLDGTREFSELDRDDWAVHVALWERGDLVAGAVALPARGMVLATGRPLPARGTYPPHDGPIRVAVSRTRPPAVSDKVRAELDGTLIPMGSAGAKVAAVILGEADIYVHAGGQYEWDSAAPVAVARAAGLHCSRIDGSELRYNQDGALLPDLLVCPTTLAPSVLAVTTRA